jgi:hypothetical protein
MEQLRSVSTGSTGASGMSWSYTFHVWMPFAQYFYQGYAMHEYPDVPS